MNEPNDHTLASGNHHHPNYRETTTLSKMFTHYPSIKPILFVVGTSSTSHKFIFDEQGNT
jgi:hypothetical protein